MWSPKCISPRRQSRPPARWQDVLPHQRIGNGHKVFNVVKDVKDFKDIKVIKVSKVVKDIGVIKDIKDFKDIKLKRFGILRTQLKDSV